MTVQREEEIPSSSKDSVMASEQPSTSEDAAVASEVESTEAENVLPETETSVEEMKETLKTDTVEKGVGSTEFSPVETLGATLAAAVDEPDPPQDS